MTQVTEYAAEPHAGCCHHWMIEAPNGPTSFGTCRSCGEVREFKNSVQITSWESEGSHAHKHAASS